MIHITIIYKYELNFDMTPVCDVKARIFVPLKVDFQNGIPFFWAIVSDDMPEQVIRIHKVGTGCPMDYVPIYLNTTVLQSEPFVWHWFYEIL